MANINFKPGGNYAYGDNKICHATQICIIATHEPLVNASTSVENSTVIFNPPLSLNHIHAKMTELKDKGYDHLTVLGEAEIIGKLGEHLVTRTSPLPENTLHDEL